VLCAFKNAAKTGAGLWVGSVKAAARLIHPEPNRR